MSARSQQREFEARTQRALQFIADTMRARGYPPSRQEIADHVGYAGRGATQPVIERLVQQGLLRVEPGQARTITITEAGMKALTEEL